MKNINLSKPLSVGMLSLGCPKTLVDSEVILGKLDSKRFRIVDTAGDCDIALLNTCSFIKDSQEESLERIMQLIELKKEKRIKAVVVMGCLVQQFPKDLREQLKEVDAFIGSGEYAKIPEIMGKIESGDRVFSVGTPGYLSTSAERRIALTPHHYRYLKISEGCDHICAFCTIPTFRGKHRSRTIDDIVEEAEKLAAEGAKELILTGQDTTYFGRDWSGQYELPKLLKRLDKIKELEWIRLLYAYPSCITEDLMQAIGSSQKICHYLDMPLQHASDRMLQAMKRGMTKRKTSDLIKKFRSLVPGLAIRTTFIVGFPGETEEDFEELLALMEQMRFERLGIFSYSREENSAAWHYPAQVSEKQKQSRLDRAMKLQQRISLENNKKWLGKNLRVLVETRDEKNPSLWMGRSYMDAPEVDGNVIIKSKDNLSIGSFQNIKINSFSDYDLVGEL